ncbi:MAG: hypothetical protein IJE43_10135 [Alphaproteobacteria bacterium]|nr:hypothetical protein [Alphaproteobacteria bacterium]
MYSSEDLERFYFQYKTEALPLGMSIETFCLKNKVPYNIFSKWYKDTRKKVVEVQVDGIPMVTETSSPKASEPSPVSPQASKDSVRILIDLHISNGLHIQQKNLSYQSEARAVDAGYFLASGFKPQ